MTRHDCLRDMGTSEVVSLVSFRTIECDPVKKTHGARLSVGVLSWYRVFRSLAYIADYKPVF